VAAPSEHGSTSSVRLLDQAGRFTFTYPSLIMALIPSCCAARISQMHAMPSNVQLAQGINAAGKCCHQEE